MRCIRTRVRLSPKKKGRKGYIAKTVFKLVKYIYYRLKKLTSRHRRQYGSSKLQIIIKYRHPITPLSAKGPSPASKLKTYKKTVPLYHPANPNFPFINFWHQLDKKALILQVIQVCKLVPRRIYTAAQYICIEATDFIRCHLRDWILASPAQSVDQSKEDKENLNLEDITLMANEPSSNLTSDYVTNVNHLEDDAIFTPNEFLDFGSDYIYGKIPLKKTELPPAIKKTPTKRKSKKKVKLSDLIVFHKQLKGEQKDHAKMRQTRIEEFFKPRTSLDTGATSRGAIKKAMV